MIRRDFLRGTGGVLAAVLPQPVVRAAEPAVAPVAAWFDVRTYGATGDGKTIDTPAVNRAIEAAPAVGGGMVIFSAGTYACYTSCTR